jgi:tetratricopeptide (TPR) repeat protein
MIFLNLPRAVAWSIAIAAVSGVPTFAQGMAEMGAAHGMSATLGAGLHSQAGSTGSGMNKVYGSLNRSLNGLSGGSGGGSSAESSAGSGGGVAFDALGAPIDPRLTVQNAGKESNHLYDLAVQKEKAGKNLEAEQLYRRSLAVRERIWGTKDPAVFKIMNKIAQLLRKRGDLPATENCYRAILTAEVKHFGAGEYDLVPTLEKLGQVCFDEKKYDDSYNFFQQVYTQRSRKLGLDSPETVTSALELARAYTASGNLSDAADVLSKTVNAKSNDTGSPQMVKLLEAYMGVLDKQNKQEEYTRIKTKLDAMKPVPVANTEAPVVAPSATESTTSATDAVKIEAKSEVKTTASSSATIKAPDKREDKKVVDDKKVVEVTKTKDAGH